MAAQDAADLPAGPEGLAAIKEQLAATQRALAEQQAEVARQIQRIDEVLRAEQAEQVGPAEPAGQTSVSGSKSASGTRDAGGAESPPNSGQLVSRTSRRVLLKWSGAAAAAAAAAAGVTAASLATAANAPTAHAAGVGWATGTVNADEPTIVKEAAAFSGNTILQLQLGPSGGAPYQPSQLPAALAAYDTTSAGTNIGVYASSPHGTGLYGVTNDGTAASGQAGLYAQGKSSGTGVAGISGTGIGVAGASTSGIGGSFSGGQAPLALALAAGVGPPSSGTHVAGELYVDSNGTIWVCQSSGTFGSSPVPVFYPLSGIVLLAAPVRVVGAQVIGGGLPGVPLSAQQTYSFGIDAYVPSFAKAMIGNATVHTVPQGGHLDLWPAGQVHPNASTVNYALGSVPLSNFCIVGLGAGTGFQRGFSVWSYTNSKFIYDLTGYVV